MSPQELYREEKARHQPGADAEWREHLEALEREEHRRGNHHRLTQGEGRGLFQQKLYE